jgi:hypothetical protein
MGYLEVEPIQVGISFTLLPRRHKKKPTLITSNLGKTHCHRLFPLPIATYCQDRGIDNTEQPLSPAPPLLQGRGRSLLAPQLLV